MHRSRAVRARAIAATVLLLSFPVHADGLLGAAGQPVPPGGEPAATSLPPQPPPAPGTPTALIRPFYEHFGLELDPGMRNDFIDPARKVLDDAGALRQSGQGDCLDPNMALDNAPADAAQIAKSLRTAEILKGDEAKVIVAFVEDGHPHRLEWKLRKVGGDWKISDLFSVTGDWALSQYQCQ